MAPWCAICVILLLPLVAPQSRPPITVTVTVREEMDEGTLIGNLAAAAGLHDAYPKDVVETLRFTILTTPTLDYSLELTTGSLMTRERIDREQICPMLAYCTDNFDITVRPFSHFQIIKVTVVIEDINDNWPTFAETSSSHQLLESAALGTSIPVPSAIDPDSPIFSIQNYTFNDPSEKFQLEQLRKMDGSTDLKLVLIKELDREWEDEYKITVTAYDGAGLSGSTNIFVTVLDANDNNPVFQNHNYEVTIQENTDIDRIILRVEAMDLDIGNNCEIIYGFSSRTQTKYGDLFEIDQYSGDIRVIGEINYETNKVFYLSVYAEDQGPGSLPADSTVTIYVEDMNDNAPEIVINTLTEPENGIPAMGSNPAISRAEVAENSEVGTFVAHVTVSDQDEGDNGRFDCFLNNDNFRLDNLYGTEYTIVTAVQLDRESEERYELMIECADYGEPMQTSTRRLHVSVGDKNDHEPVFEKHRYTASVHENNYDGLFITRLSAADADIGKNGEIRYVLSPEVAHLFNLDDERGILSAKVSLNCEDWLNTQSQIRFDVYAYDQGDPQKYGTTKVVVNIQDVNDESPEFTQQSYSFGIFENEPVGTFVGKVTAVDKDAAPYNVFKIIYAETNDKQVTDLFNLDENTGEILALITFDTEHQPMYRFTVMAKDTDEPKRKSTANVTVYIGDQNDNAPKFIFPSQLNRSVQISGLLDRNEAILRIRAVDIDQGENSRITYSIASGNSENIFSINSATGILRPTRPLNSALAENYELEIMAADNGEPPQISKHLLHLHVNQSLAPPSTRGPASLGGALGARAVSFLTGHNLLIVILLALASAVIAVILLIAIIVIYRRSRDNKDEGRYNCRQEEAKKILSANNPSDNSSNCDQRLLENSHDHVGQNGGLVVTPQLTGTPPRGTGGTLERNRGSGGTLERNRVHTQLPQTTLHSNEPSHTLQAQRRDRDQESFAGSCQDSGRGGSEDEYGTPVHLPNGARKNPLPEGSHYEQKPPNGLPTSSSSYAKKRPNFRTFSPASPPSPDVIDFHAGSSHSLNLSSANHTAAFGAKSDNMAAGSPIFPGQQDITMRSLLPNKPYYSHTLHTSSPQRNRAKGNNLSREDHSANSYRPGLAVDDIAYSVNEFIKSNAREDAV